MSQIPRTVTHETNEFIIKVMKLFTDAKNPVGTTGYWLRKLHPGAGYDHTAHKDYRKLLKALNILEDNKRIRALRTGEDTVWYLPYSDYKTVSEFENLDD